MWRYRTYVFVSCFTASMLANANLRSQDAPAKAADSVVGTWTGRLSVGAVGLKLVLQFEKGDDGKISGSLEVPNSGRNGKMSIDSVSIDGTDVEFSVADAPISFVGKLNSSQDELAGTWTQGRPFHLKFTRSNATEEQREQPEVRLNRPRVPVRPFPYDEQEVVVKSNGVTLAGTLTVPQGKGPFPAIVLISGSGPQDRDESVAGHRPFLVLADHLTRRGVAVLRCDDRGVGKSTGDFDPATALDFQEDTLAAVRFCQHHEKVDRLKVGLCGHSVGGLVASLVASDESARIAFVVLMASPGVTGEEILYRQAELVLQASGVERDGIERNDALLRKMFSVVKNEENPAVATARVRDVIALHIENASAVERELFEQQSRLLEAQVKLILTPWFRWFLVHDPAPVLAKVKCPVLAINGEKDLQVDPTQNLPVIGKTLVSAGHTSFLVKEFPKLNHLFQTCTSGSPSEYGQLTETISPGVLNQISEWVVEQTR